MSNNIQNLIDAWENRPRRQLDYSGLTEESLGDLEWTNSILKALIPSMREIREKFQLEPTPPIVLQMPAPRALSPAPAVSGEGNVQGHPEKLKSSPGAISDEELADAVLYDGMPANQSAQTQEQGSSGQSKKVKKGRAKPSSTGSRAKKSKVDRNAVVPDQKSGNDSKSASGSATPPPEPGQSAPSAPSSPASAATGLSDPPPPAIVQVD